MDLDNALLERPSVDFGLHFVHWRPEVMLFVNTAGEKFVYDTARHRVIRHHLEDREMFEDGWSIASCAGNVPWVKTAASPPTGMSLCGALRLGKARNKAIRRAIWTQGAYLYHGMANIPHFVGKTGDDERGHKHTFCMAEFWADDWELSDQPYHGPLTHPEDLKEELMRSPEVQTRQPMSFQEFAVLMCADLTNEYTHMAFYLYHSSFVRGIHAEEYAGFFKKAAEGEMQHISEFLQYIHGFENLGLLARNVNDSDEPALYVPAYGLDFKRFTHPVAAMQEAIRLEETVIDNYITRIKQAERLYEPHATAIKLFYEKQLEDSYGDVKQMRRLASQEHRAEIT